MTVIFRILSLWLVILNVQASTPVPDARQVEYQPVRFGDYKVHYSAFNSTFISPEIAGQYHLKRDGRYGIVNVSIRKLTKSGASEAVKARLRGSSANLLGQSRTLEFREIKETDAVYYLAGFQFSGEELLIFTVEVTPDGSHQGKTIQFEQKFYQEE